MADLNRITFNPDQCGGKACIRGMRIRVKDILYLLIAGVPKEIIFSDYPDLEPEDIDACLEWAGPLELPAEVSDWLSTPPEELIAQWKTEIAGGLRDENGKWKGGRG